MIKGTKTTLVADLRACLPNTPIGEKRDKLWKVITNAERGDYHDFESTLDTPFPKMRLHNDLLEINTLELLEIDEKMRQGEYDDSPFEEEKDESKDN